MNALTMFDARSGNLPAHVANFFGDEGSNIADKATVPSLSYEGKTWTIALDGAKTKLMRRNADGDEEPVTTMKLVILDYGKRRGRAFYEGEYDPSKASAPLCWSDDGVAPDASIQEPKAKKCGDCPLAVKGSKISAQGKAVTACSQHRMLAVVPANKLDFTPLRLKIAMTSDFDKQSPDAEAQGWYAFSNYMDFLKSRGVQHTAALVTKIKFDTATAYPKLFFSPDRWLEAAELATVAPIAKSDEVKSLLAGTWTPAGADGVPVAAAPEPEPEPEPAPVVTATVVDDDDGDGEIIGLGEAPAPVVEAKPVVAEKPKPAPKPAPKPVEAKAAEATAQVSTAVSDDVAALLADWGQD